MSDAGTYSCIVKNVGGQVQHDAVITVAGMFVLFTCHCTSSRAQRKSSRFKNQLFARALGETCVQNYCVCDSSRNMCKISEIALKLSKKT